MYQDKIGIIGGFGAYATLGFYQRILEIFASDSEINYPHIIMDNNFTMPSRTRALLYDEKYEEIVSSIAESIELMIEQEVKWIVLVCGTAHYFLDDVYEKLPSAKEKVTDIIENLGLYLSDNNISDVLIIAAEGALKKKLYPDRLKKYGLEVLNPSEQFYSEIRFFIEAVKQNKLSSEVAYRFIRFLQRFNKKNIILGCTEFPILIKYISELKLEPTWKTYWEKCHFFDPLEITLIKIKNNIV